MGTRDKRKKRERRERSQQTKHKRHSNKIAQVPHREPRDEPGQAQRRPLQPARFLTDQAETLGLGASVPRYHRPAAALPVIAASPDVVDLAVVFEFLWGCRLLRGGRFRGASLADGFGLFTGDGDWVVAGCGMEKGQRSGSMVAEVPVHGETVLILFRRVDHLTRGYRVFLKIYLLGQQCTLCSTDIPIASLPPSPIAAVHLDTSIMEPWKHARTVDVDIKLPRCDAMTSVLRGAPRFRLRPDPASPHLRRSPLGLPEGAR